MPLSLGGSTSRRYKQRRTENKIKELSNVLDLAIALFAWSGVDANLFRLLMHGQTRWLLNFQTINFILSCPRLA
jgi:hypothetical protein